MTSSCPRATCDTIRRRTTASCCPPILMFHPDYEFVDDNGDPIELPENRIVPPELVPPGLDPCRSSCLRLLRTSRRARPLIAPRLRALLLTLAATAASALAFALYTRVVWPLVLLGWVGFVPWLAALDRARSLRGALAIGWLFMRRVYVLAVFSWFASGDGGLHRNLAAGRRSRCSCSGRRSCSRSSSSIAGARSLASRRGARRRGAARGGAALRRRRVGLARSCLATPSATGCYAYAADAAGGRPGRRARPHLRARCW